MPIKSSFSAQVEAASGMIGRELKARGGTMPQVGWRAQKVARRILQIDAHRDAYSREPYALEAAAICAGLDPETFRVVDYDRLEAAIEYAEQLMAQRKKKRHLK